MKYFIKLFGYSKSNKKLYEYGLESTDSKYWEIESKIWFSEKKPRHISKGDILIQYVSSQIEEEKHRIIGYYECILPIQRAVEGQFPKFQDGKVFQYYIKVNNLNCKFSKMSINETILNMKDELLRAGLNRIPIYGNGWAEIDEKIAIAIINRISIKSNSFKA